MTIFQISTEDKSDLFDFAIKDKFNSKDEQDANHKKMLGKNLDIEEVINQRIDFINTFTYFIIDRECFANEDIKVVGMFKSIKSFVEGKAIPIFMWSGIKEEYKNELINKGITNLIIGNTLDEIKEEILECFSEKGMRRYGTTWKTGVNENYEKYIFSEDKVYAIQIMTTDNNLKCKSIALSLSLYINKVGGKVLYYLPLCTDKEVENIAIMLDASTIEETVNNNEVVDINKLSENIDKLEDEEKQNKKITVYKKENMYITNEDVDFTNFNYVIQDIGYIDNKIYENFKNNIIDEAYDKNVIICDLNQLEIEILQTLVLSFNQKILLLNSTNKYINIDNLSSVDKDFFGQLDKTNRIKRLEKQDEIIDLRTNRNIFYTLIEPNIISQDRAN